MTTLITAVQAPPTPVPTIVPVWPGTYPTYDPERRANPQILCPDQKAKVVRRIERELGS